MKHRIDVTQHDIDLATRGHMHFCPIALACRRVFNYPVTVASGALFFGEISQTHDPDYALLPIPMRNFVDNYDLGSTVEPFTFYADPENLTVDLEPEVELIEDRELDLVCV